MFKRSLLAAALMVAFSAPAFAFHCPKDIAAIDKGMAKAHLSSTQKAEVKQLRDDGKKLHESGKHKESTDKLSAAMRIILSNL